jgi:acyl-CoA thioesterase FadM
MTLYFRLIWVFIRCLFIRKQAVLKPCRLRFRVLPFDCDINLHLNNARYFSFMDLGRLQLMAQTGLFKQIYKERRWVPVIAGIEMTFLRALDPLQSFELVTRVLAWDEYYAYMEQRFESKGTLMAIGVVKGVFLSGKKKYPIGEVMASVDPDAVSPPLPEVILHWQNLARAKKKGSSDSEI